MKRFNMILVFFVSAFLSSLTLVLSPYYLGIAIDNMVNYVDFSSVSHALFLAIISYCVSSITSVIQGVIASRYAISFVSDKRKELHASIQDKALSKLDPMPKGRIRNYFVMDGEWTLDALNQGLVQGTNAFMVLIVSLWMMFNTSIVMTLGVLVMMPFMYITSRFVSKHASKYFKKQQEYYSQLVDKTSETIESMVLIKTSNYQDENKKQFKALNEACNDVGEKAQFISAMTNPSTRFINNLSYIILGITGTWAVLNTNMSIGMFTSFISFALIFSKPFNEISAITSQLLSGKESYRRIKEFLMSPSESNHNREVVLEGNSVSLDNVTFSYDKKHPLFNNLSFEVEPLSKIAIVGPTGSGKSTLINLLMRYYDVDSGTICIDDVDTSTISRSSTRNVMSIVLQDPWLFEGSIFENIRYGKEQATLDEVIEASKKAGCHEFISNLDDGYESMISLGSKNISVGQKQMITIARALLMDAPIYILDEATSNVDSLTEKRIQQAFITIMKDHTSFFVAHRLSTVVDADRILVMKEGQLIEQGTHDELMRLKGFYAHLYRSQFIEN